MPKHHFQQLYPVQIKRLGPLRINWTMRSEAWYQVAKRIAESSNYKETEKRILEVYSLRSGLRLASCDLASLGDAVPLYAYYTPDQLCPSTRSHSWRPSSKGMSLSTACSVAWLT